MAFTTVEIYPPIGIARVGDSAEHYLASEDPNAEHAAGFTFRGRDGKIKPCAVTFRAFGVDQNGQRTEATRTAHDLTWTVRVANKKAAWVRFKGKNQQEIFRLRNPRVQPYDQNATRDYAHTEQRSALIINATATISNQGSATEVLQGHFRGSTATQNVVNLGKIQMDDAGRLIFIPGTGEAKCITGRNSHPNLVETFDNNDWYDTMCDGDVSVSVRHRASGVTWNSTVKTIVIAAPPKFTNGIRCISSLYDVIEDIYERPKRFGGYNCGDVYYESDIQPIIDAVYHMSWTNQKANEGHGPHKADRFDHDLLRQLPANGNDPTKPLRQAIFKRLRAPVIPNDPMNIFIRNEQASEYFMPRLSGDSGDLPEDMDSANHRDRWASLTELQYDRFREWAEGRFRLGNRFANETEPNKLTRAALVWTTGSPLFPGIEVYWQATSSLMYDLRHQFRFHQDVKPGDLTKGLSLPWQADFYLWPHVRPDAVVSQGTWKKAETAVRANNVHPDMLTTRSPWVEGFMITDDKIGSTEMVKKWNKLGFISAEPNKPSIFVETERTFLRRGFYTITHNGRFIGLLDSDTIGVVPTSQLWYIEQIDPLASNLYRLRVIRYGRANNGQLRITWHIATVVGDEVKGQEAASQQIDWLLQSAGSSNPDEYTIAITGQTPRHCFVARENKIHVDVGTVTHWEITPSTT